MESSLLILCLL